MTNQDKDGWVRGLHPKRQGEFFALDPKQQALILAHGERTRRAALRAYDHQRRGINGRENWVGGLEHLSDFVRDQTHIFDLVIDGRVDEVEAMTDILVDFKAGEHSNTKNTDPCIYDLVQKASAKFDLHKYDSLDFIGMAEYFKKNQEPTSFVDGNPNAQQVAQKKL